MSGTLFAWLKALHIIFMVCWFAGVFYLPRIFVNHAMEQTGPVHERLCLMERKLYRFITPFAFLTIGLGLWMLFANSAYYLAAGWMHAKLLLVALLCVYHAACGRIVRSFAADVGVPHRFAVRVLGVGSPSWRGDARGLLHPVPTATPGVQAWVMSREEAATLTALLRRRGDCAELPTGVVQAANGLPAVLQGGRRRPYVQDVQPGPPGTGWQSLPGLCDEGVTLEVQPLVSPDGAAVEAVLKCRIDQIERMAPVTLSLPSPQRQRLQIEVPQVSAVRVGERFRWPASQVLVVGLGLVPWPVPGNNTAASAALLADAKRTDVVVVVEPRLRGSP